MEQPADKTDLESLEKERLKFTMGRIDHYYDSVNNKSAVYLAINTFITGGIIAAVSQDGAIDFLSCFHIALLFICLMTGVSSLILIALASIPYVSPKKNSLYYFGSIGADTEEKFKMASKEATVKSDLKDLRAQVFNIAKGLTRKFKFLRIVGLLLVLQFILIIIIILLITKNYFLL